MKRIFASVLLLSAFAANSAFASENEQETITLTKAELKTMVENMHYQLMAEKAAEMKKAQEARREEMQKRFFFRSHRNER